MTSFAKGSLYGPLYFAELQYKTDNIFAQIIGDFKVQKLNAI